MQYLPLWYDARIMIKCLNLLFYNSYFGTISTSHWRGVKIIDKLLNSLFYNSLSLGQPIIYQYTRDYKIMIK